DQRIADIPTVDSQHALDKQEQTEHDQADTLAAAGLPYLEQLVAQRQHVEHASQPDERDDQLRFMRGHSQSSKVLASCHPSSSSDLSTPAILRSLTLDFGSCTILAEGGTRTRMGSPPADFESAASAISPLRPRRHATRKQARRC